MNQTQIRVLADIAANRGDPIDFSDKRCEEASSFPSIGTTYIPCGAPATTIVYHERDGKHFYFMCDGCADHNVRNRRGVLLAAKGE